MIKFAFVLAFSLLSISTSFAQNCPDLRLPSCADPIVPTRGGREALPSGVYGLRTFNAQTFSNSFKCDLGEFARSLGSTQIAGDKLKAKVTYSGVLNDTSTLGAGVQVPLFSVNASGGRQNGIQYSQQFYATYNIHEDNSINCKKVNRIPRLLTCLKDAKPLFMDAVSGSGSYTCGAQLNVTYKADASAGIPWLITIGPTLSWQNTATYQISVAAPPGGQ